MRQWDLRHRENTWTVSDKPIEEQDKDVLIDVIYDLQAIIEKKTAIIETMAAQQDKFLSVLRPAPTIRED